VVAPTFDFEIGGPDFRLTVSRHKSAPTPTIRHEKFSTRERPLFHSNQSSHLSRYSTSHSVTCSAEQFAAVQNSGRFLSTAECPTCAAIRMPARGAEASAPAPCFGRAGRGLAEMCFLCSASNALCSICRFPRGRPSDPPSSRRRFRSALPTRFYPLKNVVKGNRLETTTNLISCLSACSELQHQPYGPTLEIGKTCLHSRNRLGEHRTPHTGCAYPCLSRFSRRL